jgi:lipoprotein NlpI
VSALNDLGNLYKAMGRMSDARAHYNTALQVQPQLGVAWNNLGCVDLEERCLDEAVHNFAKAMYYDPQLECPYHNIVSWYFCPCSRIVIVANTLEFHHHYDCTRARVCVRFYPRLSNTCPNHGPVSLNNLH